MHIQRIVHSLAGTAVAAAGLVAVGVNCTAPRHVEHLLRAAGATEPEPTA